MLPAWAQIEERKAVLEAEFICTGCRIPTPIKDAMDLELVCSTCRSKTEQCPECLYMKPVKESNCKRCIMKQEGYKHQGTIQGACVKCRKPIPLHEDTYTVFLDTSLRPEGLSSVASQSLPKRAKRLSSSDPTRQDAVADAIAMTGVLRQDGKDSCPLGLWCQVCFRRFQCRINGCVSLLPTKGTDLICSSCVSQDKALVCMCRIPSCTHCQGKCTRFGIGSQSTCFFVRPIDRKQRNPDPPQSFCKDYMSVSHRDRIPSSSSRPYEIWNKMRILREDPESKMDTTTQEGLMRFAKSVVVYDSVPPKVHCIQCVLFCAHCKTVVDDLYRFTCLQCGQTYCKWCGPIYILLLSAMGCIWCLPFKRFSSTVLSSHFRVYPSFLFRGLTPANVTLLVQLMSKWGTTPDPCVARVAKRPREPG